MLAQKVSQLLAGQVQRSSTTSNVSQCTFQVYATSCNEKPIKSENTEYQCEYFETPRADNYFSTNIQTLGVYQSARVSPRVRKQNQDVSKSSIINTTIENQTLDTSEVKSKYNQLLKTNREQQKELNICQHTINIQGKQLFVFEKREALISDLQEKMQSIENELTFEKKQKKNYIRQLQETRRIQQQTLLKLDTMEMAMNELEAMKSNYKRVLKGQQATLSLCGNTKVESERSTSNLEKTMSSYFNFSSKKKEQKAKANNTQYNNEYKPNDEFRTSGRMNRLNKLQNLQIEPTNDYKHHRFSSYHTPNNNNQHIASESSRNKQSQQLEQIREGFVQTTRRELKNDYNEHGVRHSMNVTNKSQLHNPYLQSTNRTTCVDNSNKRRNATSMTNFNHIKSERGHRRNLTNSEVLLPVLSK